MAICEWCSCEMTERSIETCSANHEVEFTDGSKMPSLPFHANPISAEQWMKEWSELQEQWKTVLYESGDTEEAARKRCAEYLARSDRCADCGIKDGGKHHPGCDNEMCPKCSGQLISCDCDTA